MKSRFWLVAAVMAASASHASGQGTSRDSSDIHYYDNWPGTWHRVDGGTVDSLSTFEVRRGPGTSFLEDWYLVVNGKRSRSFGLRAWDPEAKAWRLVWVADEGLFQVWDGIRRPDGWYVTREFGSGANAFLSRQAWIPLAPDRLLRTIERSTDGGRTWSVRYRDEFRKLGGR